MYRIRPHQFLPVVKKTTRVSNESLTFVDPFSLQKRASKSLKTVTKKKRKTTPKKAPPVKVAEEISGGSTEKERTALPREGPSTSSSSVLDLPTVLPASQPPSTSLLTTQNVGTSTSSLLETSPTTEAPTEALPLASSMIASSAALVPDPTISSTSSMIHLGEESTLVFSSALSLDPSGSLVEAGLTIDTSTATILAEELSNSVIETNPTDLVVLTHMDVSVDNDDEDEALPHLTIHDPTVDESVPKTTASQSVSKAAAKPKIPEVTKENATRIQSDDVRAVQAWRQAPGEKKWLHCAHCQKSIFGSYHTFVAHMSEVHGEKTNVCPYCDKKFTRKTYLKLHMENFHDGKNAEEITCNICDKQFLSKHTLKKHKKDIHENTEPYNCPHCDKAYRQESSLRDHVLLVHLSAPKYLCPHCSKGFMSMKDLNHHRQHVHLGKKAPRSACPDCGKVFTEAHLRKHIASVHQGQKLKCDECELEFSGRAVLTRHKEVVHAKRRYRCTLCLAEYRDFNAWKKHHQSQHIGLRFPCQHCERIFKSRTAMKRHAETAHRGVRFACTQCNKSFSQRTMLLQHTKVVHLGEFPHPCSLCDGGFSRPGQLKDHMLQIHHVVVDDGKSRNTGKAVTPTTLVKMVNGDEENNVLEDTFEDGPLLDERGNIQEGEIIELNDSSLDEATIITTIADSDQVTASLEAALGSNAIVIASAPLDAPLPVGAQIIEPSNIVFATDLPSATVSDSSDVATAVIYNGEVVTSDVTSVGTAPFFEFV